MFPNFIVIALAAIIPMIMGFIYYHPKVFGNVWMKAAHVTEDQLKKSNMAVIFIAAFILSFFLAFSMFQFTVHQTDYYSLLVNEPGFGEEGSAMMTQIAAFMETYGSSFRTFKHGAFHGGLIGVFFALPILMTNGLFETKGFKYGIINGGYWIITLALMGGVVCQWG
jgi:hypothetical protein